MEIYLAEYREEYKIGQSIDVPKRMKSLLGQCPDRARLVLSIPAHRNITDREIHKVIEEMGYKRINRGGSREWFFFPSDSFAMDVLFTAYSSIRREAPVYFPAQEPAPPPTPPAMRDYEDEDKDFDTRRCAIRWTPEEEPCDDAAPPEEEPCDDVAPEEEPCDDVAPEEEPCHDVAPSRHSRYNKELMKAGNEAYAEFQEQKRRKLAEKVIAKVPNDGLRLDLRMIPDMDDLLGEFWACFGWRERRKMARSKDKHRTLVKEVLRSAGCTICDFQTFDITAVCPPPRTP